MGSVRIAALAAIVAAGFTAGAASAADYVPQQPVQLAACPPPQPYGYGPPPPPHCLQPCPPPQQYGPPPPPHCLAPPPPPPPQIHYQQHYQHQHVHVEEFGGWYIRGDIGMTNQMVNALDNALYATATGLQILDKNFEAGMLFGFGVGYKWNSWMRFDVTAEYRGETGFHGMDVYTLAGDPRFNNYTGKKSEWLYLFNVYADLGTWGGITPFIGAGIGLSRIGIHSFRDAGIANGAPTLGYADSDYKWNVAYAFHAGLAYEVTKNVTLEFAYRYVYLGDGQSGDIIAYDGTNAVRNPMLFKGIDSHDLKFGMRYLFASGYTQPSMPQQVFQPLMRKF
jgi:opacity protein-like surface antigen